MSTLRTSITELASHFAAGVLNAIRGASLEEILAETNRTGFSAGAGASGVKRGPGRPKGSGASNGASAASAASSGGAEKSGGKKGRRGRLGRRSASDISAVVDRIVALLGQNPKGLRAEQIRAKLGLDSKELPRPIADALAAKKISKQGEKRATTYFARGAGGKATTSAATTAAGSGRGKRGAKKGAAKPAGKAAKRGAKKGKRGPKGSRKAAAAAAASSTESAPAEAAES